MTQTVCDRCGAVVKPAVIPPFSGYVIKKIYSDKTHELDFCKECRNDFLNWLEESNRNYREERHGQWIGTDADGYADGNPVFYEWTCSECGYVVENDETSWNYCPSCGARMDGDSDD